MATINRINASTYQISLTAEETSIVERARAEGPVPFKRLVDNFLNDLKRQQEEQDELSLRELFNRLSEVNQNFIIAEIKARQP